MNSENILSSLFAASLITVAGCGGDNSNAAGSESIMNAKSAYVQISDARLAQATPYRGSVVIDGKTSTIEVFLVKPDAASAAEYLLNDGDYEMVVRVTDDQGTMTDGLNDDNHFILKPISGMIDRSHTRFMSNNQTTRKFIGMSCNSSRQCATGETFYLDMVDDTIKVVLTQDATNTNYLPSEVVNVELKKAQ